MTNYIILDNLHPDRISTEDLISACSPETGWDWDSSRHTSICREIARVLGMTERIQHVEYGQGYAPCWVHRDGRNITLSTSNVMFRMTGADRLALAAEGFVIPRHMRYPPRKW